jgi:hypothetical protein
VHLKVDPKASQEDHQVAGHDKHARKQRKNHPRKVVPASLIPHVSAPTESFGECIVCTMSKDIDKKSG